MNYSDNIFYEASQFVEGSLNDDVYMDTPDLFQYLEIGDYFLYPNLSISVETLDQQDEKKLYINHKQLHKEIWIKLS